MTFALGYSYRQKVSIYLNQLNNQKDEKDSKYFSVITLSFAILSGIALNYQQYITSAVLYMIALAFDLLDSSFGLFTGRLRFEPLFDKATEPMFC